MDGALVNHAVLVCANLGLDRFQVAVASAHLAGVQRPRRGNQQPVHCF